MSTEFKNYVVGAIFGEAIGDALGHPIEFQKTHKVIDLPSTDPKENRFTDDTQMFCAIGEALLETPPHVDEEIFMQTLGKKFNEWRHNPLGGNHRAPGGNCMDAVRKLGAGVSWTQAGGLSFKGNGSAMRSGVVGAYYWRNPEYAFRIGALTSVCTHNNLEALLGAGMVAYLVAASIHGDHFADAVAQGLILCSNFEKTLPFYPKQVSLGTLFDQQNPWYATAQFGAAYALGKGDKTVEDSIILLSCRENIVTDGAVVPAVAEAIYFNSWGMVDNFKETVLTAVNNSDDTDTIGAITGTIAGARYGSGAIPEQWMKNIEMANYFNDLAQRIWTASENYIQQQHENETMAAIAAAGIVMQDTDIDYDELFQDEEEIAAILKIKIREEISVSSPDFDFDADDEIEL